MKKTVFNPYQEALGDGAMKREATRQHWRRFCCKCSTEQPIKGGVFPDGTSVGRGGALRRFICAGCLAKLQEKAA
jgi:hypothetical protein